MKDFIKLCENVETLQDLVTSLIQVIKNQTDKNLSNVKPLGINQNKTPVTVDSFTKEALAPYLLSKEYPKKWVRPKLPQYKGDSDPLDHIHKFRSNIEDVTDRKDLWCRMFRRILKGDAINWYVNLPNNNINNFEDLQSKFLETFNHLIKRKTDHGALLNVRQK